MNTQQMDEENRGMALELAKFTLFSTEELEISIRTIRRYSGLAGVALGSAALLASNWAVKYGLSLDEAVHALSKSTLSEQPK